MDTIVDDLWLALEWYDYILWLTLIEFMHMFDVMMVCTYTAFSRNYNVYDIVKQED